ncbi:MAG: hypothetical protein R3301_07585 [Saprospiraceae bacterium]|nr:hypothetical protein [Saprospiraceae bacterium]
MSFERRSILKLVMTGFGLGCLVVLCHPGCINAPDFADVPKIEFVSMSKDTLRQGVFQQDSLVVTFHFEDGDGDIGREEDAPGNNVFFIDKRTGQLDNSFGIPFIPPQGSSNGVEGDVHILLYSTCCLFPNGQDPCTPSGQFPTDQLEYEIYIIDRAGNESNRITTPVITLLCD